jgi:RimJ/RimL family protein N-acetyltransferase
MPLVVEWTRVQVVDVDVLLPVDDEVMARGRTLRVRPITRSDADALVRFHEQLTGETTRLRFFSTHPHLSPKEVEGFTRVDHVDREALVALDGFQIVAVGRYDRLRDQREAEVAFVVSDAWQGHGVGTLLLERLARRARAAGIHRFVADTLDENHRMRQLFRRSGPMTGTADGAGVIRVVLDLDRERP